MSLLLTNSIYFVFSSLQNQRRLAQTKDHYKFFTLSEKNRLTNSFLPKRGTRSNEREPVETTKTPCLSTPVGTARLTGENVNFEKFFVVKPRSRISTGGIRKSTGETTEPTGDDMKIRRVELTNILH